MVEVVFGEGFWGPIVATASMLLIAAVGWFMLEFGRAITKPKPTEMKLMTYGCGEVVKSEEAHPESEYFFSPVRRVMGRFYGYLRLRHGGDLGAYLFWVTIGLLVILAWVAISLRVV